MHVKTKDTIVVLAGKNKGARGEVRSVDLTSGRIIVAGVNLVKKHSRANPKTGAQGGIVQQEAPLQASNVMLVCPKCSEPTRAKSARTADGKASRSCRACGAPIDK